MRPNSVNGLVQFILTLLPKVALEALVTIGQNFNRMLASVGQHQLVLARPAGINIERPGILAKERLCLFE